jgi:hypothetical protein
MRFNKAFHIDCRARCDEDHQYYARARITSAMVEATLRATHHDSGDLDAFSNEVGAIEFARSWAIDWCDRVRA